MCSFDVAFLSHSQSGVGGMRTLRKQSFTMSETIQTSHNFQGLDAGL